MSREKFRAECGRLWDIAAAEYKPHIVVGIQTGGWWVAEAMQAARAPAAVAFLPMTCRRDTSSVKDTSRAFLFFMKVLPYGILNLLRIVEYYLLTVPRCRTVRKNGPGRAVNPDSGEMTAIQTAAGHLQSAPRILVVDDSLDSGSTLANVTTQLRAALPPGAEVRTAAFTVLGAAPVIEANFFLYRRVNFRFPWSFDFHG